MFRRLLIRRQFPTLIIITVSYKALSQLQPNILHYYYPSHWILLRFCTLQCTIHSLGEHFSQSPLYGQMLIQPHCRSHFTGYLFITWVERSDTDKMPCSMTYQVWYRGSNPRPLHYQSSGKTIAFNYDIESLTLTLTLKSYIEHNLNYCPILDYLISV